jgi:hypothetical protein
VLGRMPWGSRATAFEPDAVYVGQGRAGVKLFVRAFSKIGGKYSNARAD